MNSQNAIDDQKSEKKKEMCVNYGDLAFQIISIKRINDLPDDIQLSEFYKFLTANDKTNLIMMEYNHEQGKDNHAGNSS